MTIAKGSEMRRVHASALILFFTFILALVPAAASSKPPGCDPQLGLDKMEPLTVSKDRMQDFPETAPEREVLRLGKDAVPALIACLTDERKTKTPVFDFWPETRVGDIAFSFLVDLFRDKTLKPTLGGVITHESVRVEFPNEVSSIAWERYLRKHGRRHIQQVWAQKWAENEHRIYWDKSARCFRTGGPGRENRKN